MCTREREILVFVKKTPNSCWESCLLSAVFPYTCMGKQLKWGYQHMIYVKAKWDLRNGYREVGKRGSISTFFKYMKRQPMMCRELSDWKNMTPVMTCRELSICPSDARCFSSAQLKDWTDEDLIIWVSIFDLFGDRERLNSNLLSILYKCCRNTCTASAAWRPCKSNFHKSFLLFLTAKISLAALVLSLSAANHFSWALREHWWAEKWSALTKALVAALECCAADLLN